MEEGWFKRVYKGLVRGENLLGHFLLLVIRLYWGGALVYIGFQKLTGLERVKGVFQDLGIPYPHFSSYLVGLTEFLGGIALFLGLGTRIMTIPLAIVFIVAYATAHKESIVNFTPDLFFSQHPFLFLYATLVVMCFGPGFFSLDYWLEKRAWERPLK